MDRSEKRCRIKTGEPITLVGYHATDAPIEIGDDCLNPDTWFTDKSEAADFFYSGPSLGLKFKAEVRFDNPLVVSAEEFSRGFPDGPPRFLSKAWHLGHDGVIIRDIVDGYFQSTVFAGCMPKDVTAWTGRIKILEIQ